MYDIYQRLMNDDACTKICILSVYFNSLGLGLFIVYMCTEL